MLRGLKKFWKVLGPGLITGAADNDPAGIAAYSIAGARFGFMAPWLVIYILPLMIAVQEMSARIGALSACGLAGNIKRHYPTWLLAVIAGVIVLANTFNIGANIYGMASALNLVIPLNEEFIAIALSAIIVYMTVKLHYRQIVSAFKWISLSLFAYVFALIAVHPHWGSVIYSAVVPRFEFSRDFLMVAFAVMGTTISPYLYFWQSSEEAEQTRLHHPGIRVCRFRPLSKTVMDRLETDTVVGMVFSNIISFFIITLTATVIFSATTGSGNIETLREIAQTLEPIAGEYAYLLFTAGILGAGLLAIPVLAGSAAYVLAEVFNWREGLDRTFAQAREFYVAMTIAVLFGLLIPFIGITPVQALFYTGILNGLIAPILILMVVHMASNPAIVGPNKSPWYIKALAHACLIIMSVGVITVFFG